MSNGSGSIDSTHRKFGEDASLPQTALSKLRSTVNRQIAHKKKKEEAIHDLRSTVAFGILERELEKTMKKNELLFNQDKAFNDKGVNH